MKDLLGNDFDYVLCGYIAEYVCCNSKCNNCDDTDKRINREEFKHKYENERTILYANKNKRTKGKV